MAYMYIIHVHTHKHTLRTEAPGLGVAASRHLDPAVSETQHQTAGHAILCRVRVSGRGGA